MSDDYSIDFEQASAGARLDFPVGRDIDIASLPLRQLDLSETFTNPPGKKNPWDPDGS